MTLDADEALRAAALAYANALDEAGKAIYAGRVADREPVERAKETLRQAARRYVAGDGGAVQPPFDPDTGEAIYWSE